MEFMATKKSEGNMFMKPCRSLDNRAKDNTTGPVFLHCIMCNNRKYGCAEVFGRVWDYR